MGHDKAPYGTVIQLHQQRLRAPRREDEGPLEIRIRTGSLTPGSANVGYEVTSIDTSFAMLCQPRELQGEARPGPRPFAVPDPAAWSARSRCLRRRRLLFFDVVNYSWSRSLMWRVRDQVRRAPRLQAVHLRR